MRGVIAGCLFLLLGTRSRALLRHGADGKAAVLGPGSDGIAAPSVQQASSGVSYAADVTSREGLGENLPYPSVDYLGVGYDLFRGNPDGDEDTQIDPGFRNSVIQLKWDQGNDHLSRDMRYLQPVGGYAFPAYSCHQTSSSRELASTSDYQHSLSVDASIEGDVGGPLASASFSASAGFSSFSQDVEAKESERFEMVSYCLQFSAGFDKGADAHQEVTPHFADFVESLPKEVSSADEEQQWMDFFAEFGTHYITHLDLGGKMIFEMTIDRSSMEKLRSSSVDVSAAVEASYGIASGSVSASTSSSKESAESLSSANTETKTMVLGGLPPETSGSDESAFGAWASSVREAPMPVKYKLTALSALEGVDTETYDAMILKYKDVAVTTQAKQEASAPHKPKSALLPGEQLVAGDELIAGSKKVKLQLTPSGELVLSDTHGNRLWKNGHEAGEDAVLEYTFKGNLVIKTGDDTVAWETSTGMSDCGGKPPGKLIVQDDGNVVVLSGSGDSLWSTRTQGMKKVSGHGHGHHESGCGPSATNQLKPGEKLMQGQRLTSTDQRSYLELTPQGELNLYCKGKRKWHSHHKAHEGGPFVLKYQKDGNLVVRNSSGDEVWSSGTNKGGRCNNDPGKVVMTDSANFVAFGSHGEEIWSTDTGCGYWGSNMDDPEGDFEGGCDD